MKMGKPIKKDINPIRTEPRVMTNTESNREGTQKLQWVSQENLPLLLVLKEILETLKRIEAKL